MVGVKGHGSIYQRSSDGLWIAAVPVVGRKKVIARGADYVKVQDALDKWRAANPVALTKTRAEHMVAARALGTHTQSEVRHLYRTTQDCRYCRIPLDTFNSVEDHIVSIVHGGSDAIDNIQIICWECNAAKGDSDDYVYSGTEPRAFKPLPIRDREGWYR